MKNHAEEPSRRFQCHESDDNAGPNKADAAQHMMHRSRNGIQHPVPAPAPAIRTDEQDEDREFVGTFPVMPSHPGPSHDDSTPLAAIAPASASDASPIPPSGPSLPSPSHHPAAAAEAVYTRLPPTQLMQQMAGLTERGGGGSPLPQPDLEQRRPSCPTAAVVLAKRVENEEIDPAAAAAGELDDTKTKQLLEAPLTRSAAMATASLASLTNKTEGTCGSSASVNLRSGAFPPTPSSSSVRAYLRLPTRPIRPSP
ncbi:unnamed protein product [Vitrella brassicaformis CCMP3155]|uniref:Uncharacterized protein n=1 Tax=Vitrella brassicaformis (strain CCMP3155) TaxID=1169540 RepID=A0A0G4F6H6_VITBC|nr:unnamed protein product [Vitrella brassicaformis CCMP3155]|eukprot:CEM08018.1 unnamed protein product [Vitrella brassicaformis CCMP3155]